MFEIRWVVPWEARWRMSRCKVSFWRERRELVYVLQVCWQLAVSKPVWHIPLLCVECVVCCGAVARCALYDAHLATAPQHIPTKHDMLPQHLVCKYEFNCEYCNIILARNKAPWWWCDKIETCRSVLKVFYVKLYVHSLVDKLKWFYENARC